MAHPWRSRGAREWVTSIMLTPLRQVAACILRRMTVACTFYAAAAAPQRCRPVKATAPS